MGAVAAWASVAIAAGSAAYGAKQNSDAKKANERAYADTKEGYEERLKMAGEMAKELNKQYNEIVKDRPSLTWESFVRDKIKAIDDPFLRAFYTKAKTEDFNTMKVFADAATKNNTANLMETAEEISGGRFKQFLKQRDDLVANTNAAARMARTYELAAPVRTAASTVRYDDKGRLIEGQRADKQAFDIANEVVVETEREQKADLAQWERDRFNAAQSQQQKATDFMRFFDATGYATAVEADRSDKLFAFQATDEERAFELYKMFAGAAAGMQPGTPAYVPAGPGNEMIANGVKMGSSALSAYQASQAQQPKSTVTTY